MNQSTLANTHSANFQSTSAGQYKVTPLFWNSSLAPNASAVRFLREQDGHELLGHRKHALKTGGRVLAQRILALERRLRNDPWPRYRGESQR